MISPDLSVILPNYNHAPFLPRALDALLAQSPRAREVIVVDDGSTDDSLFVLQEYARKDASLRLVRHPQNQGVVAALESGVRVASGKYLFLAAADDYILPGFFAKSLTLLNRHPQAGLCCAFSSTIEEGKNYFNSNANDWLAAPGYLSPPYLVERFLQGQQRYIPGHASILKRKAFDQAGGLLPQLRWHSDWFTTLVMAFREGICHIPETLALFTVRSDSYLSQGLRDSRAQGEVMNTLVDLLLSPAYRDVAPYFVQSGALEGIGESLARAIAKRPDRWQMPVLALVNSIGFPKLEGLFGEAEPEARVLLPVFYRLGRAEAELARTREIMAWLDFFQFWRLLALGRAFKKCLLILLGKKFAWKLRNLWNTLKRKVKAASCRSTSNLH